MPHYCFVVLACVLDRRHRQKDETEGYCSDSASASTIHLSGGPYNGMVLYFREVSRSVGGVLSRRNVSVFSSCPRSPAYSMPVPCWCNSYLALVCLVRSESFDRRGLLDYNVSVFKSALTSVFDMSKKSVPAILASIGK
jgi:hypothetical protein